MSPTCLSQRVTVPSVTDSPRAGIFTARARHRPRAGAAAAAGAARGGRRRRGRRRPGAGAGRGRRAPAAWAGAAAARPAGREPCRRVLAVAGDHRELGADLGRLVLADHDPGQHAGGGRRDLGVDLVGGDLEQRLVDLDPVALLLEPAGDGALGDALAQPGHGDRYRHVN